jgi:hypothetical protein
MNSRELEKLFETIENILNSFGGGNEILHQNEIGRHLNNQGHAGKVTQGNLEELRNEGYLFTDNNGNWSLHERWAVIREICINPIALVPKK